MKKIVSAFVLWLPVALLAFPAISTSAQEQPALLTLEPVKENPADDELLKLQKSRFNETITELKTLHALFAGGKVEADRMIDGGSRLLRAGLDIYESPAEKVGLLTRYVELTRYTENRMQARHASGVVGIADLQRARYERLDAEIELVRAKREQAKKL